MTPYASSPVAGAANATAAMAPGLASRYGMGSTASAASLGSGAFAASLAESSAKPVLPVGALNGPAAAPVGQAGAPKLSAMALNTKTETETRAAIHKSAADFESSALGQLLGFMTQNIEVNPTFGGGHGEEMFRDMMNTEYGKMLHKGGRTGIADQVERQLLRAQGLKPLQGQSFKV